MSEVVLHGPGVVAVVGEFVTAGMAQHVGMDGEVDTRVLASAFNELPHGMVRDGAATFRHEQIRGIPGSRDAIAAGRVSQALSVGAWTPCRLSIDEHAARLVRGPPGPSEAPPVLRPAGRDGMRSRLGSHRDDRDGPFLSPL